MNRLAWQVLLTLALLAALIASVYKLVQHIEQRGFDRAAAEYAAAIKQLQADAATELVNQTNKTRRAEQALHLAKTNQDVKDAQNKKTVDALSQRVSQLAVSNRLRDPHATPSDTQCGGGGGGPPGEPATTAAVGATDRAQTGGLLSEPLTRLLERITREADEINAAYVSCRADAYTIRRAE